MNYPKSHEEDADENLHVLDILNEMRNQGLEGHLIHALMLHCLRFEGLRDLMEMWFEETDPKEKEGIIADLQESISDIEEAPKTVEDRPYLYFDDLEAIKGDVVAFKERLRAEVDKQGGISELARKSGIPQASLSRFFSSSMMPRRTTLFKIAKALDLPETAIGFKWTR